jgi:rubrerythrin
MADYCGFFTMREAAHAREQLRRERILTEIVLREPPDPDWDAPPRDEFWLRVDASRAQEVQKLMQSIEGAPQQEQGGTFACSECGHEVADEANTCPSCGARFDED